MNQQGNFGFIIPNTWFTQSKYADMKSQVFALSGSIEFVDLGFGVFTVTVPTSLLIVQKNKKSIHRHADLKMVEDKESLLSSVLPSQKLEKGGGITSHPIVEKYLTDWPDDFRLAIYATLREGQHIPRKDLTAGHSKSNV